MTARVGSASLSAILNGWAMALFMACRVGIFRRLCWGFHQGKLVVPTNGALEEFALVGYFPECEWKATTES